MLTAVAINCQRTVDQRIQGHFSIAKMTRVLTMDNFRITVIYNFLSFLFSFLSEGKYYQ